MRVVDLDRGIFRQVVQVRAALHRFINQKLCRIADHEIFLIDSQQAAFVIAVVRVKEESQVFCNVPLIETDAVLDDPLINRVDVEKTQTAAFPVVSGHVDFVHYGRQGEAAEVDRIAAFRPAHPVFSSPDQPGIGLFFLHAVGKYLTEKTFMVGKADTVGRQAEGGAAVQEAGGQPPESAVPKGRLRFKFFEFGKTPAGICQFFFYGIIESEIDQVIAQQLADQKFRRYIVKFFPAAVVSVFFHGIGCQVKCGIV